MGGTTVAESALVDSYPDVYLSTGLVAENHARVVHLARRSDASRFAAISAQCSHRRRTLRTDRDRHRELVGPAGNGKLSIRELDFRG